MITRSVAADIMGKLRNKVSHTCALMFTFSEYEDAITLQAFVNIKVGRKINGLQAMDPSFVDEFVWNIKEDLVKELTEELQNVIYKTGARNNER